MAFMIQPVSGDCCSDPCSRSGPCDPCDNWEGCDGTEPESVVLTITYPDGTEESETYTKNEDFCRYDAGTAEHITWFPALSKWRVVIGTQDDAESDVLIGEYSTLVGSNTYVVTLS